jgi:hypothetical protein
MEMNSFYTKNNLGGKSFSVSHAAKVDDRRLKRFITNKSAAAFP